MKLPTIKFIYVQKSLVFDYKALSVFKPNLYFMWFLNVLISHLYPS
jgi:hypothetical protein